jgi:hypothetical protein
VRLRWLQQCCIEKHSCSCHISSNPVIFGK